MDTTALMAISPLDGRYRDKVSDLSQIFSEFGLIRFRVLVEVRWLLALTEDMADLPQLGTHAKKTLLNIANHFSEQDALRVKQIEATINHDVKAVEYFIKERIAENKELAPLAEFIHFGCTSEDINNLAYSLMTNAAKTQCILPGLDDLVSLLKDLAHKYANLAMLCRTHGQPATPSTLGKEIANVVARLKRQIEQLKSLTLQGKLNGATGNFNALAITYPEIDWQALSYRFIKELGLDWNQYTTQIEPHDSLAEFAHIIKRINTILIDFNRDIWGYISIQYFKQKMNDKEVGSSTMPHKVNPIDFENSEGNLGISNALLDHFANKLPISRWQRDLSDSTVLRNIGVALGHASLAYQSCCKGIQKLEANTDFIKDDLNQHWEVLAEAIQTVMRRYKLEEPYEQLKAFTRGKQIDKSMLHEFIQKLDLPNDVKTNLLALTPAEYVGFAEQLAKEV